MTGNTGAVTETQEKVGLVIYEGPTAQIGCELGYTMNLGDYQSARMTVTLTTPSNIDSESLDKTFQFVKNWCDAKLTQMITDAKAELG